MIEREQTVRIVVHLTAAVLCACAAIAAGYWSAQALVVGDAPRWLAAFGLLAGLNALLIPLNVFLALAAARTDPRSRSGPAQPPGTPG